MAVLYLEQVPTDIYERLRRLAKAHNRTVEAEAVALLDREVRGPADGRSQGDLLADLRRRSFTPPAGTRDSVELLREDRGR
jgi:plasmid stability protein